MWVALAAVVVSALAESQSPSSEQPCPDPAEVETQLVRLGVKPNTRPEITVTGDKMRVVLRDPGGEISGSREVETPASCHERSTVAAVLVATWMGVWPETGQPNKAIAAPEPPAPRPQATAESDGQRFGLALGLAGGFDGNAFALGASVEANGRLYGPLRGRVGLSAFTDRDKSIGSGQAAYTRPAFEAGPSLRLGRGRIQGEIGLSGLLGLMILHGKGLTTTYWTTRTVPGAGAWLRLLLVGQSLSPFLTAGGTTWFRKETATLDDDAATATLPSWDVQLGLGVFWGLR